MADRLKVMTVLGARPQFIKAAPLSRALAASGRIVEVMVHTGQHFDANMSDVFFSELGLPKPDFNLEIHGGGHGEMTGRMLRELEVVMLAEQPAGVVVFGDTNSTLAAALAASKLHIPVFHVEAGLRSFNRAMPEEINRVVADHLSDRLFCPSPQAMANLQIEGLTRGAHMVGDVMYDATLHAREAAEGRKQILADLGLTSRGFAVCTIHRAENTNDLEQLGRVLAYLEQAAESTTVVWPVHPRTRAVMEAAGLAPKGVKLIDPIGYLDLHCLLANAASVFTDSGGLQKEAYFHRVPCVTLRDETEWVETIEAGWNRLWTGPDYRSRTEIDCYGDGHAADKIVSEIVSFLTARNPTETRAG